MTRTPWYSARDYSRCYVCGRRWPTMSERSKCEQTCAGLRAIKRMEERAAETRRAALARLEGK